MSQFTKDIILIIANFLKIEELLNLSLCCKFYYNIIINGNDIRNSEIWNKNFIEYASYMEKLNSLCKEDLKKLNFKQWSSYQQWKLAISMNYDQLFSEIYYIKSNKENNEEILYLDKHQSYIIENEEEAHKYLLFMFDNPNYKNNSDLVQVFRTNDNKYFWSRYWSQKILLLNYNENFKLVNKESNNILFKTKNGLYSKDGFKCITFSFNGENYKKEQILLDFSNLLYIASASSNRELLICKLFINNEEFYVSNKSYNNFKPKILEANIQNITQLSKTYKRNEFRQLEDLKRDKSFNSIIKYFPKFPIEKIFSSVIIDNIYDLKEEIDLLFQTDFFKNKKRKREKIYNK
jgi:hypothetical protein